MWEQTEEPRVAGSWRTGRLCLGIGCWDGHSALPDHREPAAVAEYLCSPHLADMLQPDSSASQRPSADR